MLLRIVFGARRRYVLSRYLRRSYHGSSGRFDGQGGGPRSAHRPAPPSTRSCSARMAPIRLAAWQGRFVRQLLFLQRVVRFVAQLLCGADVHLSDGPATNVQSAAPGSGGNSDRAFYSPAESFPEERAVSINIAVPTGASIWFDGVATTQQGALRRFISPRIEPDHEYVYNVTAKWTSNGKDIAQSRRLVVHAGDVVNVTFGSAAQR